MNEVLAEVTAGASDFSHPLMAPAETGKRALIVVSTDKGTLRSAELQSFS